MSTLHKTLPASPYIDGLMLFSTIKGTAMNKDRGRVWIESERLADFGFERGARIEVRIGAQCIRIETDANGSRKVAGRERGGRTICILDICMPAEQRAAMFNGASQLAVNIMHGCIFVTAAE